MFHDADGPCCMGQSLQCETLEVFQEADLTRGVGDTEAHTPA